MGLHTGRAYRSSSANGGHLNETPVVKIDAGDERVVRGDELNGRRWIWSGICSQIAYAVFRHKDLLVRMTNEDERLVKFLVVDSEERARGTLIQHCERSDDIRVVGEAESGIAAINATRKLQPDVLLLNVDLPDMSGFDVLRAVRAGPGPLGILVTTRTDHAVTAFAEGALDCLIKPVSVERFDQSMTRARQRVDSVNGGAATPARREPARREPPQREPSDDDAFEAVSLTSRFLVGERHHRLYPLDPATVDYIESDANYVTIRSGKSEYISRNSIKHLGCALADFGFVRIKRSLLVNIRAVSYVEAVGHGTYAFTLASGACLHSSATFRDAILRVLPLSRRSSHRAD